MRTFSTSLMSILYQPLKTALENYRNSGERKSTRSPIKQGLPSQEIAVDRRAHQRESLDNKSGFTIQGSLTVVPEQPYKENAHQVVVSGDTFGRQIAWLNSEG